MTESASAYLEQLDKEIKQTPEDQLPNLLDLVRIFRRSVGLPSAQASFKQGWKEAMGGETKPLEELWDGIET